VKKPPARALSLYDGQVHIGTIKIAEDGTAVALNPKGKRLGQFPSLNAAYPRRNRDRVRLSSSASAFSTSRSGMGAV
jgi:hypothetical protein